MTLTRHSTRKLRFPGCHTHNRGQRLHFLKYHRIARRPARKNKPRSQNLTNLRWTLITWRQKNDVHDTNDCAVIPHYVSGLWNPLKPYVNASTYLVEHARCNVRSSWVLLQFYLQKWKIRCHATNHQTEPTSTLHRDMDTRLLPLAGRTAVFVLRPTRAAWASSSLAHPEHGLTSREAKSLGVKNVSETLKHTYDG